MLLQSKLLKELGTRRQGQHRLDEPWRENTLQARAGGLSRTGLRDHGQPSLQLAGQAGSEAAAAETENRGSGPKVARRGLTAAAGRPGPDSLLSALCWSQERGAFFRRSTRWVFRPPFERASPDAAGMFQAMSSIQSLHFQPGCER